MATYIGVEQNTDLKCQRTVIRRFGARRKAALDWEAEQLGYAFPGAARSDLPGSQQNWHRRLRNVYEMPPGYRLPTKEAERAYHARHGSVYQGSVDDNLANLISRDGDQVSS